MASLYSGDPFVSGTYLRAALCVPAEFAPAARVRRNARSLLFLRALRSCMPDAQAVASFEQRLGSCQVFLDLRACGALPGHSLPEWPGKAAEGANRHEDKSLLLAGTLRPFASSGLPTPAGWAEDVACLLN